MSLTHYNLSEDWGWYIDIESMKPICQIKPNLFIVTPKKFNHYYNKLDTIEEDEFDYYINNQKNLDDIAINNNNNYKVHNLFNIHSTTIIAALLTYIIFVIL